MKNILLGYSDEHGKGKARILSGPEVSVTQTNAAIAAIKAGTWPQGIVRAELWTDERGRVNLAIKPQPSPELSRPAQLVPQVPVAPEPTIITPNPTIQP